MDVDDESFSILSVLFNEDRLDDWRLGMMVPREPQRVATFINITARLSLSLSFLSFIISVILFFHHPSILHASLLASPVILHALSLYLCLRLPEGLYLISLLTEM